MKIKSISMMILVFFPKELSDINSIGMTLDSNVDKVQAIISSLESPLSDIFFGIHTILHDILGFDTIYHTIFAIF